MSHAHPCFEVKVVAKYEKGLVVEDAAGNGEFFNLFKGSLASKAKPDAAQSVFATIKVGDILEVTCQDPERHTRHQGPDGALRPNVSAWLVQKSRTGDDAKAKVKAALDWDKSGGGKVTVFDVRDAFVLCEVKTKASSFVGLWHKSQMPADFSFQDLKVGSTVPLTLRLLDAQVQGSRSVIRFKLAA
jgi:hypothetical protein